jgi:hypothetical protein
MVVVFKMPEPRLRPGYAAIEAARNLKTEDVEAWAIFMQDVAGLPMSMLGSVQRAVVAAGWRNAYEPINSLKTNTQRFEARRAKAGPSVNRCHPLIDAVGTAFSQHRTL